MAIAIVVLLTTILAVACFTLGTLILATNHLADIKAYIFTIIDRLAEPRIVPTGNVEIGDAFGMDELTEVAVYVGNQLVGTFWSEKQDTTTAQHRKDPP